MGGVFIYPDGDKVFVPMGGKGMPDMIILGANRAGFFGSDVLNELDEDMKDQLAFMPLIVTDITFVIGTTAAKSDALKTRLFSGKPVVVATSYPKYLTELSENNGWDLQVVKCGSSVEALPMYDRRVDGFFDMKDSGRTISDNGLVVVAGDLGRLSIGIGWRKESK